jgi:hypothetical protein
VHISDGWYHVDSTTSDDHGWFSGKSSCCSTVDLLAGNSINLGAVFVEI